MPLSLEIVGFSNSKNHLRSLLLIVIGGIGSKYSGAIGGYIALGVGLFLLQLNGIIALSGLAASAISIFMILGVIAVLVHILAPHVNFTIFKTGIMALIHFGWLLGIVMTLILSFTL